MLLTLSSLTDIGNQRPNNEDNLVVYDLDQQIPLPNSIQSHEVGTAGVLMIISDGMGGCNAGEIASEIAVNNIPHNLLSQIGESPSDSFDTAKALRAAISQTHKEILEYSRKHKETKNMGATATLLWLRKDQQWAGHVGDSRLYRLRNQKLEQLTQDHSPVGRLLRQGSISEKMAQQHPQRHLLEQALGAGMYSINPDAFPVQVESADTYLLCTDGLNDSLPKLEIQKILNQSAKPLPVLTQELVREAKLLAGLDNISLQLLTVTR